MQTIIWSKCLRYDRNGPPNEVLYFCTVPIDPSGWSENTVLVRWIASPINPLDLNIIEGRYALISPKLPAIGGCEAVGIAERVGPNIRHIKIGDKVIRHRMPIGPMSSSDAVGTSTGVWTEYSIVPAESLLPIEANIDLVSAATLTVNPPTALALIREFVHLEAGDWIIQNAANSGVGRAVIQLSKIFGFYTLNLVRNRPNIESLKSELVNLGAKIVLTEEEYLGTLKKGQLLCEPRLALNGTGGRSALWISSALARGGILVTYGGMSKKPVEIATGPFIFKDISARGFSLGTWVLEPGNAQKVEQMFAELQRFIVQGKFAPPPAKIVPLDKFKGAIENAICHGTKQILMISESNEFAKI